MHAPNHSPWWNRDRVQALVLDIAGSELRRLRPAAPWPPEDPQSLPDSLDSLERLSLSSALAEYFQMHQVGLEDALLTARRLDDWVDVILASLERHAATIGFRTSGSTGEPRCQIHRLDRLACEVEFWANSLGPVQAIAGVVPRHHIYGFLFTILLPWRLELSYLDARGLLAGSLTKQLPAESLIVGYPDYWRLIALSQGPLPERAQGLTSTAPAAPDLWPALVPRHLSRLIEIYGSSETAGIGWRTSGDEPFRLLPLWGRVEQGLEPRMQDAPGAPLKLPDHLRWESADRFRVEGRRDAAVQVGGINVYPRAVADVLEAHPEVARAAVRLMRPEEGHRLKAFIVPADSDADPRALTKTLTDYVDRHLETAARPRAFTFGPELPRGALGKAEDWALKEFTSFQSSVFPF
ncbi:MAG: 4-coumarate--CoA ligase [Chromatiaceae bacterium]|nr:4-coumarate--CoA ligase [Chromatiaceae bacterium]